MLKNSLKLIVLTSIWLLPPQLAFSVEHPAGHGGSKSGGSGCPKVGIRNMKPEPLSEVAAGAEFSAIVFGANDPEDIAVTAKEIPVATKVDVKDDFFVVKGTLPTELKATAARINIKVKGKSASCTEENGWLVKITH